MELREKLLNEVTVIDNKIIKLDHILNHKVNIKLLEEIGKDIADHYKDTNIDTILTIETGGIVMAVMVAKYLGIDSIVYAKKGNSSNQSSNTFNSKVHSFTKQKDFHISVDKSYLPKSNVLIVDDFLATGNATQGLLDICAQADCNVKGLGFIVNKKFQNELHLEMPVYSIIDVKSIEDNKLIFQ